MVQMGKDASLHEKTVQKVAKDGVKKPRRPRGKAKRPSTSRVRTNEWAEGLHPLIVEYVRKHKIRVDRIERIGSDEIIIR